MIIANSNFLSGGVDINNYLVRKDNLYGTDLYSWGYSVIAGASIVATVRNGQNSRSSPVQLGAVNVSKSNPLSAPTGYFGSLTWDLTIGTNVPTFKWKDIVTDLPITDSDGVNVSTVAMGISSSNNEIYGWGSNWNGVINGYQTASTQFYPYVYTPFTPKDLNVVSVALGPFSAAAVSTSGLLYAWGKNIPDNFGLSRSSPSQIGTLRWRKIFGGSNTFWCLRQDDTLWAWGDNVAGATGIGTTAVTTYSSPVQIGTNNWNMISSKRGTLGDLSGNALNGGTRVVGVRSDGGLFTWGSDIGSVTATSYGSLGLNLPGTASQFRSAPTQIGTSSWTYASAGSHMMAAIRIDGGLFTWGRNDFGQLGLNDQNHRSSPVQVGTSSWVSVSCGASHLAAIRSDGTLFMWGSNADGELGQLDSVHRSSPVQVGTLTSWRKMSLATRAGIGLADIIAIG